MRHETTPHPKVMRTRDAQYKVETTLEELYTGGSRSIKSRGCHGAGGASLSA